MFFYKIKLYTSHAHIATELEDEELITVTTGTAEDEGE